MGDRMTVVRREARRRWLLVLGAVAVLCATPAVVAARPFRAPVVDAEALRAKMQASGRQAYQGYAESVGALGLPQLPRLGQVIALVSGTTRMRAWYGKHDRWRVDVIDTGTERSTYRTPEATVNWDFAANQLTVIETARTYLIFRPEGPEDTRFPFTGSVDTFTVAGESPARLPRGADLLPPALARRLLDMAAGEPATSIPGKRVAGIAAAGLRLTSADPHSTIGHIDIWADPRTGLPLEVAVTARNAERPILVTRFLEVAMTAPTAGVLTPPQPREGLSYTTVDEVDEATLVDPAAGFLPEQLAGLPRVDNSRRAGPPGEPTRIVIQPTGGEVYGTGLTQILVVPLAGRVDREVLRAVRNWGQQLAVPDGDAAIIAAPLLSVMVVHSHTTDRTYLIAGMIDGEKMRQVGVDIAAAHA
jgi:hypothetical protein